MTLSKLLYNLVPKKVFLQIRQKFYVYRKKMHKPLTVDQMKYVLINKLHVESGNMVFVHSSMDFLNIDFPTHKLLNLLLELVGDEGTLIFPAWHFNYRAEDYLNSDKVFDLQRSPSAMGLLSEFARRNKMAFRSIHPTTSIVAIGKHARELTEDHQNSIYPCGEKSPYYKMMKYDAKIIGLGVTAHFVSFLHCPEDVLNTQFPFKTRTEKVFVGKVKLPDGECIEVKTLAASSNIGNRDIPGFFKKYVSTGMMNSFKFKGNSFYVAFSKPLFDRVVELAKSGITIYNVN
ncbi:MAG: AAC(3) family N-acetyltransferase [Paludibacter sp.]|nr:AAC(3) family N-acetyltransferase [Paludibacter sp.]